MKSNSRSIRLSKILKKEISFIVKNILNDPRIDSMITITSVKVSIDLCYAKVFVTLLDDLDSFKKKLSLKGLQNSESFIQHCLSKRINVRVIPKIYFILDMSYLNGIRISNLINDQLR